MADNDNKELMDFLGKQFQGIEKQFERIDEQFESINKRLDKTATKDDLAKFATKDDVQDLKRHTSILFEAVDHKIDIVIEGVMAVNERLDRHAEKTTRSTRDWKKEFSSTQPTSPGLTRGWEGWRAGLRPELHRINRNQ